MSRGFNGSLLCGALCPPSCVSVGSVRALREEVVSRAPSIGGYGTICHLPVSSTPYYYGSLQCTVHSVLHY